LRGGEGRRIIARGGAEARHCERGEGRRVIARGGSRRREGGARRGARFFSILLIFCSFSRFFAVLCSREWPRGGGSRHPRRLKPSRISKIREGLGGGGGVAIHPRHGGATRLGAEAGGSAAAGVNCDTPAAPNPRGNRISARVWVVAGVSRFTPAMAEPPASAPRRVAPPRRG
jgi:hypothetical protein